MKQKIIFWLHAFLHFLQHHTKLLLSLLISAVLVVAALIVLCTLLIDADKKYVLPSSSNKHVRVGLVLGAGVAKNGKPYRELQARLDSAADALTKGQVDKLILSGDNRFKGYNEPKAMRNYLVQARHIDPHKLQPDYAGRSTYESCERAAKVFGLKETIIYSAHSHLPRAIYLCRHFDIAAYGISSGVEANNSTRRELLARVKAVMNATFGGVRTVLGSPIKL